VSGDRAYRVLLRAYPAPMRHAYGDEMAALVRDRRELDGEPAWRLWPSLLVDTARAAAPARADDVLGRHRDQIVGAIAAIAILAILSDGLVSSLPLVAVLATVALLVGRWRAPEGQAVRRASWRRWTAIGMVLLAGAAGAMVGVERELTEPEWVIAFWALLIGLFALGTGLATLVSTPRRTLSR
jgi:hypothetical protein